MPRTSISARNKERIIASYERYEDYQQIARTLGVKPGIAYAIIRRYQGTGALHWRGGEKAWWAKQYQGG